MPKNDKPKRALDASSYGTYGRCIVEGCTHTQGSSEDVHLCQAHARRFGCGLRKLFTINRARCHLSDEGACASTDPSDWYHGWDDVPKDHGPPYRFFLCDSHTFEDVSKASAE